ncbi:hypothetical protein, partial [Ralstonia pseudosolanacearum]|uniref:hypothetical protein n=2 Tax=Ralstonia pseudosolanacearum TaxID=1310165 RepID=UPI003CECA5C8
MDAILPGSAPDRRREKATQKVAFLRYTPQLEGTEAAVGAAAAVSAARGSGRVRIVVRARLRPRVHVGRHRQV